ncbi:MAG: hypothetical protein EB060_10880 [Proteobacteria bacterium]|nr:hypothetical protein [Pseudomonadota bacterium]
MWEDESDATTVDSGSVEQALEGFYWILTEGVESQDLGRERIFLRDDAGNLSTFDVNVRAWSREVFNNE